MITYFEARSCYVVLAGLELAMQSMVGSNSQNHPDSAAAS